MTLQSILGSNYKWWYVSHFNFKSASAYFCSDIFYYINALFGSFLAIFIWSLSSKDTTETLQYLIFGNVLNGLTLMNNNWRLSGDIYDGKLSSKLILPMNLFAYYFFNVVAYCLKQSIIVVFYIPLIFIFQVPVSLNWISILLVLLIFPSIVLIKFFYNIMVGCLEFWFNGSYGIVSLTENISALLSGALIPLTMIPIGFLVNSPMAFLVHQPMQILLGKYSWSEILVVFVFGLIWSLVLFIIARIIFKLGLKKNEAVGL